MLRTDVACDLSRASLVDEGPQGLATRKMAELAQRFGFDLPDPLTRHREVVPDLLQGVLGLFAYVYAHAQNLLVPRRERGQLLVYLFVQVGLNQRVVRRGHGLVLDEVAQLSVVIGARGRCEGERLPRN